LIHLFFESITKPVSLPYFFFWSITLTCTVNTSKQPVVDIHPFVPFFLLGLQCWIEQWRARIKRGLCLGFLYPIGLNGNSFLFALLGSSLAISLMASARFVFDLYHCLSSWDFL
jgi:hypothetical protein